METLTFNLAGNVRTETLEGREHLVVPAVMLTEGVHAGSMGPLYYPADELGKAPAVWNHKPIVVYHPKKNGQFTSACDPDVLNTSKVGIILNTRFEDKKLKIEAWLDKAQLKGVDERIFNSIEKNEKVEVSTGLGVDFEQAAGVWNQQSYTAVARNYRPDHLAILPDQKGACSIEDGAGLLANKAVVEPLTVNAMSFDNIHTALCQALRAKFEKPGYYWDGYVYDVFPGFFVYRNGDSLYAQKYETTDSGVKLTGEPEVVVRVTEYRKATDGSYVGNASEAPVKPNQKESVMFEKKKHIDSLIGNGWEETDRAALEAMPDAQLKKILPTKKEEPVANKEVKEEKPAPTPAPAPKQTWAETVANADPATQEMLKEMTSVYNTEKTRLVAAITANSNNPFSADELNGKSVAELRKLAALCPQPTVPTPNFPAYFGAAGAPPTVNKANDEEPLVIPELTFGK